MRLLTPSSTAPHAPRPWRPRPPTSELRRGALYLMLKPDEQAGRQAQALAIELKARRRLRGWPTDWDRLHITLAALEWLDVEILDAVSLALAGLSMPPFVVAFDRMLSFRSGGATRPLVLLGDDGVFGVRLLHAEIEDRLARAGVRFVRGVGSTPHLTLFRDRAEIPETFVGPVAWTVREILLILSIVEERRHIVLDRWPLWEPTPGR
jgi:2'-5' RNA ligase